LAQRGQAVFDLRRAGRQGRPGHDAVSLEATQRAGQHLLRDAGDIVLRDGPRRFNDIKQHDDEHAPFLTDPGEDLADLLAVPMQRMGEQASR